jgi:hypothetical protein
LEKALEIKQKAEYVICMQNNDILSHSRTESNLKWLKLFSVLKWFGRSFHRVAAANMNDFLPYLVVLT